MSRKERGERERGREREREREESVVGGMVFLLESIQL